MFGVETGVEGGPFLPHFPRFSATKKAQLKAHKWLKTALFDLAERVGFEPTRPFGLTDFESAPL